MTATVMKTVAVAGRDLFNRHGSFNVSPVEWPSHDGINWWRENALGKLLYRLAWFFGLRLNFDVLLTGDQLYFGHKLKGNGRNRLITSALRSPDPEHLQVLEMETRRSLLSEIPRPLAYCSYAKKL